MFWSRRAEAADLQTEPELNVIPRFREFSSRFTEHFGALLLVSGILGALVGAVTATWQAPVETAQVLTGFVKYDPASLQYAYHASVFSILNYIAAALLVFTGSEVAASVLLCAIVGVAVMQMLAMLLFLVTRNFYLAILGAVLVCAVNLVGYGISYPIYLFGTAHAFGRAGLFIAVYALLFFALGRNRAGFFFAGLTLAVHPSWGLWLNVCLWVSVALRWRTVRPLMTRANAVRYIAGAGFSVALLVWHKINFSPPDPTTAVDTTNLFANYIRYWDYHRQRFGDPGLLVREFIYAAITLVWAGFLVRKRESAEGTRLFFTCVIVATIASVPLVFVPSWFDPLSFPRWFTVLMPGRYINVPILIGLPVLLGFVLRRIVSLPTIIDILAAWALLAWFLSRHNWNSLAQRGAALLLIAAGLLIMERSRRRALMPVDSGLNTLLALGTVTVFLFIPVYLYRMMPVAAARFERIEILESPRMILTSGEQYLLQAETRSPVITPILDGYPYIGAASLIQLNTTMKDLFGVSLEERPPAGVDLHRGQVMGNDLHSRWQSHSCSDWERLAKLYGFDLIVVPNDVTLRLPVTDANPKWNRYRPTCDSAETGDSR